jgi:hypothetical protein
LSTIFPPGGQAGSTFEVTVTGADLDDATQLHFSNTSISAQLKIVEVTGLPEANKFIVTISSNAPLGIYEARVAGRFGISNPRAFAVGQWPETTKSGNNSIETAAEIALATTINGHADQNAVNCFKLAAKKGQRVLVECAAQNIDSRMSPSLILLDSSGRELERNRRGGLLDFSATSDGTYYLQVHDFLYGGGGEHHYRLTAGTAPHIDYVFPPSGLPGTTNKYLLYGRNLPGSTPAKDLFVDGKPL